MVNVTLQEGRRESLAPGDGECQSVNIAGHSARGRRGKQRCFVAGGHGMQVTSGTQEIGEEHR